MTKKRLSTESLSIICKYLNFKKVSNYRANSAYKMLQALTSDVEIIGPIQMGLNKPIHFIDFESSVQDIVNVTAVAAIDAMVNKDQ